MEKAFNSDSEPTNPEKPSISLAGLLSSAEIPNLKELFYDKDIGCAAVHMVDEKFVIHSEIFGQRDRKKLGQVMDINIMIDDTFRAKGVEKLYTYAMDEEQYRFNQYLGYKPNGKEMIIPGYDGPPIDEFEKVLIV